MKHRVIEVFHTGLTALDKAEELKARSKRFAIRIVQVFRALPRQAEAFVLGKQLLRSGTSVAANYRAVCRARSKPEFIAKMGVVVEEADETVFWLELLIETGIVSVTSYSRSSQPPYLQRNTNESVIR